MRESSCVKWTPHQIESGDRHPNQRGTACAARAINIRQAPVPSVVVSGSFSAWLLFVFAFTLRGLSVVVLWSSTVAKSRRTPQYTASVIQSPTFDLHLDPLFTMPRNTVPLPYFPCQLHSAWFFALLLPLRSIRLLNSSRSRINKRIYFEKPHSNTSTNNNNKLARRATMTNIFNHLFARQRWIVQFLAFQHRRIHY